MISRILIVPLFLVSFTGCGGGESVESWDVLESVEDVGLFRVWVSDANGDNNLNIGGLPLDLTETEYGEQIDFNLEFNDGAVCECDLFLVVEGLYQLSSCVYLQGSGYGGDPQCNSWDHTGAFDIVANVLTLETTNGAFTYHLGDVNNQNYPINHLY